LPIWLLRWASFYNNYLDRIRGFRWLYLNMWVPLRYYWTHYHRTYMIRKFLPYDDMRLLSLSTCATAF
jgi:hypothetical protein